jgi:hypothetical protein
MASSTASDILNEPLSAPPPGERPNLIHPESRASEIYIAASIGLPLILLFGGLRFYAKFVINRKTSWDDCKL